MALSWPTPSLAQEENPPARAARISYLKGKVSFQPAGQDVWSQAALNFTVTTGDRIYADKGARAELEVGPYTVRVSEHTDLIVTNLNDQIMQLGLEQGILRVSVYELPSGDTVELDTPNAALTVLEPGTYRVDVDPDGNRTTVSVNSGSLQITAEDVSQTVQAGQAVRLTGRDPVSIDSIPMPSLDDFDHWSEKRDEHAASSASAKYVSRGAVGYDDLDDYGHWQEVSDYGPVWYPNDVPADWVPYRFGHWAWIDPWGWTWVNDDAWGFCPFHYGRWVFIGSVWGWLPGPYVVLPVFAPAFVAFVGGPGFALSIGVGTELAAWFPLGPGEPFFPWYHYSVEYLQRINVTNIRNVTNITNILNVRDINQIHYKYRDVAATAVPAHVFSSGQPVAHHVVHVDPKALARAPVIPHPTVNPTRRAALPGRPVSPPPIRHPTVVTARNAPGARTRPAPGETRTPPPLVTRNRPPVESGGRAPAPRAPAPAHPATPPPPAHPVTPPPAARPPTPPPAHPELFSRTPPPPPPVPFADRRSHMMEHPGRPLEPQQLDNLRAERPPGPMRDEEFPHHVAPVVPERPIPAPVVPARPHRP
ncbi:MAG TPA: DUF6600 domain-containing protein [Candidatus Acidoferrum sp.]|nr:DUF6600 domain-containing protein [Candidatus Acidoferrum sp.]